MSDLAMAAIHASLRGLAARQRAAADNVANLETPRYLANRVSFEDSLRTALRTGDPMRTEVSTQRSMAATGVNGNNVNLDEETLGMIDTNLRYQLMVEAMNAKFRILRTSIKGA
ncbi:MAG: flagellar basal body rod C-terminal domain-containing protein [Acidimicrobiales bacterium]